MNLLVEKLHLILPKKIKRKCQEYGKHVAIIKYKQAVILVRVWQVAKMQKEK